MNVEYELSRKQVERNILAMELDDDELWECDKYHRLERQIKQLRAEK